MPFPIEHVHLLIKRLLRDVQGITGTTLFVEESKDIDSEMEKIFNFVDLERVDWVS